MQFLKVSSGLRRGKIVDADRSEISGRETRFIFIYKLLRAILLIAPTFVCPDSLFRRVLQADNQL